MMLLEFHSRKLDRQPFAFLEEEKNIPEYT